MLRDFEISKYDLCCEDLYDLYYQLEENKDNFTKEDLLDIINCLAEEQVEYDETHCPRY